MMLQWKKMIKKWKIYFQKGNFYKKIQAEKSKLFVHNESGVKFRSKRNNFKLFKSKLQFDNENKEVKNLYLYYIAIGVFLTISSIYLAVFSQYFQVNTIDIIRKDDGININMAYRSVESFRYHPLFFTNSQEIKETILSHQPQIAILDVRKILPDTIKITAQTYGTHFGFYKDEKFYIITDNGVLIPGKEKEGIIILKIIGFDTLGIADYKRMFSADYLSKIKAIHDKLLTSRSVADPYKFTYYKKEAELHVTEKGNTIIIFDLNKDIQVQVEKLNIFYKEYVKKIETGIVYIDLRINERVIYCDVSNEFQCKENLKSIYE